MRRLRLCALTLGALALTIVPVAAHPFGEPQSLKVAAHPDGVRITWSAAPDDVTALAARLGVVGGQHVVVFEDGEFDADASSVPAGVRLAEQAEVLAAYLNDRITVRVGGERCRGDLEPVQNVARDGASLVFDCGGPVAAAEIAVQTLTDIDPAYRTLAQGPNGQRHAYSSTSNALSWTLGDGADGENTTAADAGRSAVLQLGSIGAALGLGGGLWWLLRRRRAR
ncbi:hypothetical protein ACLM5J_05275 [Nocardioides sp. Bht2]|uniref:hypothetical protein n=1 Tax=Nocardioides sp. Bht2 TaxID=3392297 RepID=UPI0039B58E92